MTVLMPMARSAAKRALMSGLTMSLRWTTPSSRPFSDDGERRAAGARDAVDRLRGTPAGASGPSRQAGHARGSRRPRPCAATGPADRRRKCAYARRTARSARRPARVGVGQAIAALRQARRSSGPPASRRRGDASSTASASARSRHAADGHEFVGHAIAEGDRAGLVEQQRVDVARRLDGAAGGGDDVEADQPVHAGDADRRQQAADGRRDQADEQRDQHGRPTASFPNSRRAATASRRRSGR